MSKTAILFAGQGAQKTGMGLSLYECSAAAKKIFDSAESVMPGIKSLCFEGDQAELNKTINTQPCVYTADCAAFAAVAEAGVDFDCVAGFSLGEYAALVGAGSISFEEGLKLVMKRAAWMQDAADATGGGMAAVLGKTAKEVDDLVESIKGDGVLCAVNYNCPGQTVVAGDEQEFPKFLEYCKANRVKAIKLAVSGAFHSSCMKDASDYILEYITNIDITDPQKALYSNTLGRPYESTELKRVLARQTSEPVYFERIIRDMMSKGVDTFVEVGPGNTLTGFVRRTDKTAKTYNVNDEKSLNDTIKALTEE